jgi:hypothetical protein
LTNKFRARPRSMSPIPPKPEEMRALRFDRLDCRLLRQYFPKGTDLSSFSQTYLNKIAPRLNQRPRETLGFQTPADKLETVLR